MSGHSKWANIQHRKNAQDARRGKVFTRLIREVVTAARAGGADPAANPRLRLALEKANAANVPKDNIERAIKRASGELDSHAYEEVTYEGYGPDGVAVLVECVTDNRNRTVAEVRHVFSKYGGNLGADGSVAYLFSRVGQIRISEDVDEEKLFGLALEKGAEDIEQDDGVFEITTDPAEFEQVRDSLKREGYELEEAEVTMRPASWVELDVEQAGAVIRLIDALEDLDDTQNVYSNARFPAEAFE